MSFKFDNFYVMQINFKLFMKELSCCRNGKFGSYFIFSRFLPELKDFAVPSILVHLVARLLLAR